MAATAARREGGVGRVDQPMVVVVVVVLMCVTYRAVPSEQAGAVGEEQQAEGLVGGGVQPQPRAQVAQRQ